MRRRPQSVMTDYMFDSNRNPISAPSQAIVGEEMSLPTGQVVAAVGRIEEAAIQAAGRPAASSSRRRFPAQLGQRAAH